MVNPLGRRIFRCLLPGPGLLAAARTVPDRPSAPVVRTTAARAPQTVLVRVTGDIDLETAPVLDYTLLCVRTQRIVVDLSGCGFADCALLSVLLRARRRGELVLAGSLPIGIQRLFELTGTLGAFTITSDAGDMVGEGAFGAA